MSAVNPDTPQGVTPDETRRRAVIDGLRELADFLEANPDLKHAHGMVGVLAEDRGDLETFAAALGDRAQERQLTSGRYVQIEAWFGGVHLYSMLEVAKLVDTPAYRPILPPKDEPAAALSDDWSARR